MENMINPDSVPTHTLEYRCILGGTDYAKRLGAAIATHPEITEVLETTVEAMGKEHGHAADLRIVYRAERELDRFDLAKVTQYVPLYTPVAEEDLERLRVWERENA